MESSQLTTPGVVAQITPTSEVDTRAQLPPSVETDVNAGRTGRTVSISLRWPSYNVS